MREKITLKVVSPEPGPDSMLPEIAADSVPGDVTVVQVQSESMEPHIEVSSECGKVDIPLDGDVFDAIDSVRCKRRIP